MAKTTASSSSKRTGEYDAGSIQILQNIDHVRARPGMYIGGVNKDGLHHIVWEILDNSVDEAMNGHADEIEVTVVDRLVFFHVGGFELGGEAIETYFARSGAMRCASERAHLVVQSADPVAHARELAAFLGDEDYEEQFTLLVDGAVELRPFHDEQTDFLYTVTLADAEHACVLGFDDSGVQDWAFVAVLYQLCGMDPSLDPRHASTRTFG